MAKTCMCKSLYQNSMAEAMTSSTYLLTIVSEFIAELFNCMTGDSGGPLLIAHEKKGIVADGNPKNDLIIGIISRGDFRKATISTRIHDYLPWIRYHLRRSDDELLVTALRRVRESCYCIYCNYAVTFPPSEAFLLPIQVFTRKIFLIEQIVFKILAQKCILHWSCLSCLHVLFVVLRHPKPIFIYHLH